MAAPVCVSAAEEVLSRYPAEPQHLISVLQDLQLCYRYLPRPVLDMVSEHLKVPLSKIYGVATFYKAFSLTPRGKTVLRVCTGTACHIRGAPLLVSELKARLGVEPGGTTEDLEYTLEAVNCVGACALAPVILENETAHGTMSVTRARKLVGARGKAAGSNPPTGEDE